MKLPCDGNHSENPSFHSIHPSNAVPSMSQAIHENFITWLLLRSYWIGSKERVFVILHRCQLNYQSSRMSRRSSKDKPMNPANLLAKDKWNTGRKYRIKKKTKKSLGRNSCNLFCLNRKTNTTKRYQSSARRASL